MCSLCSHLEPTSWKGTYINYISTLLKVGSLALRQWIKLDYRLQIAATKQSQFPLHVPCISEVAMPNPDTICQDMSRVSMGSL